MISQDVAALKRIAARTEGLRRAMEAAAAATTPDHGKWGAFRHFTKAYSLIATEYVKITGDNTVPIYDASKLGTEGNTVWPRQKSIHDQVYTDVLILLGLLSTFDIGQESSISSIQDLLSGHLRTVIFSKPEREVDVQNAIETLFVGRGYQRGLNYDRESGKIKFSGREYIPDFVFPSLSLSIEVKLLKEDGNKNKCIEEMGADATAYRSAYENVLFCVYDLGAVRDVLEFQNGFAQLEGVRICIVKH